jgi:hypothetical protein
VANGSKHGLGRERSQRGGHLGIERDNPALELLSRGPARFSRRITQIDESLKPSVERRPQRVGDIVPANGLRETIDRPIEIAGQRPFAASIAIVSADVSRVTRSIRLPAPSLITIPAVGRWKTDRATPMAVHLANVGFAELDPQRPLRTPRAMSLRLQIDTAVDDTRRYPGFGPLTHELEARTDDADQVPAVHAGEMILDEPAVFPDIDAFRSIDRSAVVHDSSVPIP